VTQLPHEVLLAALVHLGCEPLAARSQFSLSLVRGAAIKVVLRCISPVTIAEQRRLLRVLAFTEAEYLAAVATVMASR
jgi:hypothetical protein